MSPSTEHSASVFGFVKPELTVSFGVQFWCPAPALNLVAQWESFTAIGKWLLTDFNASEASIDLF